MELKQHQKRTYEEVMNFLAQGKACGICNCTGSGKTAVLAEVIKHVLSGELGFECDNPKVLVLAPQDNILDQYKVYKMYGLSEDQNIEFRTYQWLASQYRVGSIADDYSLVIADELHRTGAKTWGEAFLKLKQNNPRCLFLGASATPKRYDQKDQKEDMVDIFFDHNRAGNITLKDAILSGILAVPTYIASMYSLGEEVKRYEDKIRNLNANDDDKKVLLSMIKEADVDWSRSHSVYSTLKEHLGPLAQTNKNGCTKILVFCKNIAHLHVIRKEFDPMFKKIFSDSKLTLDEYHSKNGENAFWAFRAADDINSPGGVYILYAVDKFNEGVHINNLDGIIMLRETQSEIIYFQQIGRVLSICGTEHPVIIDLVNNFKRIKNYEIWNDIMQFLKNNSGDDKSSDGERTEREGDKRNTAYGYYNYIYDAMKIFDEIDKRIKDIELFYYKGEQNTMMYFCRKYNKIYTEVMNKVASGFTFEQAMNLSTSFKTDILTWTDPQNGQTIEGTLYEIVCKAKPKRSYELVKWRYEHNGFNIDKAMELLRSKK